MPEATDVQMQSYCDQRIRPFAEAWELLIARARGHKAGIDDIYARAISANAWNDARTDGPPHLMQAGNSQSPDDALSFNTMISGLLALADGEALDGSAPDATEKAAVYDAIHDSLAVLGRAVVRVIGD